MNEKWSKFIYEETSQYFLPPDCRGGVVIDCGSNVGAFPFRHNIRFDKYVCYEADPRNIDYMISLLPNELTQAYGINFTVENRACYKTPDTTVPIYGRINEEDETDYWNSSGDSSIYTSERHLKENKIADVPTITIEEIRKEHFCEDCKDPIQLLKCDIEGAEHDFLLGKDISIFKFISMEIHGTETHSLDEMIEFISETHFPIYVNDQIATFRLKT